MVKRFRVETSKLKERYSFLTDHPKSKILFASVRPNPRIKYSLKVQGKVMGGEVSLGDFMEVKGWKAVGNRLSDQALAGVKEIETSESKLLPKAEVQVQTDLFGNSCIRINPPAGAFRRPSQTLVPRRLRTRP